MLMDFIYTSIYNWNILRNFQTAVNVCHYMELNDLIVVWTIILSQMFVFNSEDWMLLYCSKRSENEITYKAVFLWKPCATAVQYGKFVVKLQKTCMNWHRGIVSILHFMSFLVSKLIPMVSTSTCMHHD